MTNPDCPACHGTGVLRTHDHIGIVDESNCDLCSQPDPTPHQPYTCAEREWLIARVAELEEGISTAMQLIEGGFDSAAYEALEALNAHK